MNIVTLPPPSPSISTASRKIRQAEEGPHRGEEAPGRAAKAPGGGDKPVQQEETTSCRGGHATITDDGQEEEIDAEMKMDGDEHRC